MHLNLHCESQRLASQAIIEITHGQTGVSGVGGTRA